MPNINYLFNENLINLIVSHNKTYSTFIAEISDLLSDRLVGLLIRPSLRKDFQISHFGPISDA